MGPLVSFDWLDPLSMQHMPERYHDHVHHGDDEHEPTKPALKRVWRPRGGPCDFANGRIKSNLVANSESQQNGRSSSARNGEDGRTGNNRQNRAEHQQNADNTVICAPRVRQGCDMNQI
jgi:hypothetical protein